MTTLYDTLDTDFISMKDAMTIFNAYEEWRGALCEESIFDLYDDDDAELWVEMYGLHAFRVCVLQGRFWLGGENYYYDEKDKKSYNYPIRNIADNNENRLKLIKDACDECEEFIITFAKDSFKNEYNPSNKKVIENVNTCFDNIIDVSEWLYENHILIQEKVEKYGRTWEVMKYGRKEVNADEDWKVLTINDDEIWMNNCDGYMLCINNDMTLYCDF